MQSLCKLDHSTCVYLVQIIFYVLLRWPNDGIIGVLTPSLFPSPSSPPPTHTLSPPPTPLPLLLSFDEAQVMQKFCFPG